MSRVEVRNSKTGVEEHVKVEVEVEEEVQFGLLRSSRFIDLEHQREAVHAVQQ